MLRRAGLELAGPLGPASDGVRWSVRDSDGRRWAATTVLRPSASERARLRRRVAVLRTVNHPHLVRIGPMSELPDGSLVVLQDEVPGTDLETLCAARSGWPPGEVVTVLVPLAGALAALHDAGQAHGDVAPGNVVLRPDGRPVLVDLVCADGPDERGTPGLAAPERVGGARPPGDVYALAQLGLRLLGGAGPEPAEARTRLIACLKGATAPEPKHRPSAAQLARDVYRVCTPEPVTTPDAAVLTPIALRRLAGQGAGTLRIRRGLRRHRDRARHRGPGRGRRPALLAAAAVLAAIVTALAVCPGAEVSSSTVVGEPVFADPVAAAVRLTRTRAAALAAGDLSALAQVTVPGSPAAHADARAALRLRQAGLAAVPVQVTVEHASRLLASDPGSQCPSCVRVALTASTAWPGAEPTAATPVVLVMQATRFGWRVSAVEASA